MYNPITTKRMFKVTRELNLESDRNLIPKRDLESENKISTTRRTKDGPPRVVNPDLLFEPVTDGSRMLTVVAPGFLLIIIFVT